MILDCSCSFCISDIVHSQLSLLTKGKKDNNNRKTYNPQYITEIHNALIIIPLVCLKNCTTYWESELDINCAFNLSIQLLFKIVFSLRQTFSKLQNIQRNACKTSCGVIIRTVQSNLKLKWIHNVPQTSNFMKIHTAAPQVEVYTTVNCSWDMNQLYSHQEG